MEPMNCEQCRARFSDYGEKALSPVLHGGVSAHLATCPACKKELRDLQRALHAIRAVKREKPPEGLAHGCLGAGPAPKPAGSPAPFAAAPARVPSPRPPRRGSRAWLITLVTLAAAALLLYVPTLWFLLLRTRTLRSQTTSVEQAFQSRLAASSRDLARLRGELAETAATAGDARRVANEALAGETSRREALERKVALLEDASRQGGDEIVRLEKELEAARGEMKRLEAEIASAQGARETAEGLLAAEKALANRRKERGGVDKESLDRAAARQRRRNVVFRAQDGRLELSVRGPSREVIPELLSIAADESNAEMSGLALNALENLLGPVRKEAAAAESPAPEGWLDRQIQGFTNALGAVDAAPEAVLSAETDRSGRLKALEEVWREAKHPNQD